MNRTPIRRHPSLVALSKDHHFGLLLCWKIRTGFNRGISPGRMQNYVQYYFSEHLFDHFAWEERMVFTLLDEQDPLIKKALSQHRKLRKLYNQLESKPEKCEVSLGLIEELLENHIRFEERELFNHIQEVCSEAALDKLGNEINNEHISFKDEWNDVFWDKKK
ncbi:hypothetical protein C900_03531 [Fulvivirga imtechensis AK7]|uniref:Hemerythrin-like domain-containing protein n=1 Tax=Fulvivirga imtechensis AK7 TaxID=1237149 RepID=L8JNY5_9BACT|nr:hemerythrin domain-containing protein [Fulvivirga imtechensis]ELR70550.1 hypothetical protein C900_03531 [Fulvivirga imtechensis AK7]